MLLPPIPLSPRVDGTGGGGGADGGRGGRAGPAAGDADIVLPTLADQVRTLLDRALVSKTAITFFIHPSKGMTPGLRKQVLLNRHVNTGAVRFLKNRNFLPRDEGAIDSYCMELIKERADLIDGCLTLMAAERWRQLEVGDKGQLLTLLHDLCEETYEAEHFRGVVREDARKRIEEFIDAWLSPERVIDQLVGLVDRGFTEDEPVIFKEGVRLLKSLLDSSASVRIAGFDTVTPLFGWLKRLEPGRYGALLDDVAIIIERSLDQMGMDGRGGDAAVFCVHRLIEEGAASVLLDRVAARARDPEIGEVLESYRDMMPSIMEVVN